MDRKNGKDGKGSRGGLQVMMGLIGLVKPLLGIMFLAVLMGCAGNLMASFITILGGTAVGVVLGYFPGLSLRLIFTVILLFAVLRGVLRYGEQAGNHYIAFKLLARIRHQVFEALRKLAPAKLDGREKGNLISVITSDIELLEVFYAHTLSPVAIAVLTSLAMCMFLGFFHVSLGVLAGIFYLIIGGVIPLLNSRAGQKYGRDYRSTYGELNTVVLDNLYGLEEILQYEKQEQRQGKMEDYTCCLEQVNSTLKRQEALQKICTDAAILAGGVFMALCSAWLCEKGILHPGEAIVCIIALMSSFGPAAALSALSNNLNQTLASGNRVLDLLEEETAVHDVHSRIPVPEGNLCLENVSFAYPHGKREGKVTSKSKEAVVKEFFLNIEENTIHGILGRSGCGKSTLLKLLMRFYETDKGVVRYGRENVNSIDTRLLRKDISYVTQDTFLFQDTIENNLKVAKVDATREEVIEAAKKASIHDFIMSLPQGYDTKLSELGEGVSGGERQRLGIARAFLHHGRILFLDEPTSNIDSLNESMILKSLLEEKKDKTIVLVSHRTSTMSIAEQITKM